MKLNHSLIVISMVIISLLAIGVASASEDVSDVIETTDFEEVVAIEDSEIISEDTDNALDIIGDGENDPNTPDQNNPNNGKNDPINEENDPNTPDPNNPNNGKNDPINEENDPNTPDPNNPTNEENEINNNPSNNRLNWLDFYNKENVGEYTAIFDLSDILHTNKTNSSFLALDFSGILDEGEKSGSYLVLGLSDILGRNGTDDNSYFVFALSSLFDKDNTAEDSFLVLSLSSLGFNNTGTSAFIIDLTDVFSNETNFETSYLSLDLAFLDMDRVANISLPTLINKSADLLDIDLTKYFNEDVKDLPSFLDNLNWSEILGEDHADLSSTLNDLNWTAVFDRDYEKLADSLNFESLNNAVVNDLPSLLDNLDWTELLGGKETNTSKLLNDLNWTALFEGNYKSVLNSMNVDSIFGYNISDIPSLSDFDFKSIIQDWNLSSLIKDLFGGNDWNLSSLIKDLFGRNTGNDDNSGFDLSSIIGGKDSASSMVNKALGWITGKIINSNANNSNNGAISSTPTKSTLKSSNVKTSTKSPSVKTSIKSSNVKTYYDKKTAFKVTVMSGNKPVKSGKVVFIIKNKKYTVKIGSKGVAVLKLKLRPGTYVVTTKYGKVSRKNKIVIKKSIITKNVSKKYKKAGKFTVKVLNKKGKAHAKQTVKIRLKGKIYTAKTNKKGIATFKLPKKLKVGKYTIKTTCKGLTISNKLTVKK